MKFCSFYFAYVDKPIYLACQRISYVLLFCFFRSFDISFFCFIFFLSCLPWSYSVLSTVISQLFYFSYCSNEYILFAMVHSYLFTFRIYFSIHSHSFIKHLQRKWYWLRNVQPKKKKCISWKVRAIDPIILFIHLIPIFFLLCVFALLFKGDIAQWF